MDKAFTNEDFDKYNSSPLNKKGQIFVEGIEIRASNSLEFIKTKYNNFDKLNSAINFIEYHYTDGMKADFEGLVRIGYFPATETQMELDHAIKHALIGSYKAAFADLRRALELTLTAVYLTSEHIDETKARQWMNSQADTPFVSTMLVKLIKSGRFKDLNDKFQWSDNLKKFYWHVSDFAHNKGQLKGYRELNQTNFFMSGTSAPRINYTTLSVFCDAFITCVEEIVVILSLYNPVLLVPLPVFEKFGFSGPMSGFFEDVQSEAINKLVPDRYKDFFEDLKQNDLEVKGLIEWFASMPDLSDDEIKEQIKQDEQFLSDLNSGKFDNIN